MKGKKNKKIDVQYEKAGRRTLQEVLKIVGSIEKKISKFEKLNPLSSSNPNEFVL
ncbi:MAG TPA: hypothetical protein VLG12_08090 [Candidatus Saccharimonadales bacterium]|nr:hypothetical protein [Candidatus Saccharimonadales bacterium]